MKIRFNKKGFTLMEILVSVALFTIVITIVTQIFMIATRAQRRVSSHQKVQSDVRMVINLIVERMRMSEIDYDYYENKGGISVPETELVLRDIDNKQVIFRQSSSNFLDTVCVDESSVPCFEMSIDEGATWAPISSLGVNVPELSFYITPIKNPFVLNVGGYPNNDQPKVTISGQFRSSAVNNEQIVPIDFQTTISTRIYKR